VECVGDFELTGEAEQFTVDRDSLLIVDLAELLRAFRYDPSDPYIGRVRITIQPANDLPQPIMRL
jgi:hypothetical protein